MFKGKGRQFVLGLCLGLSISLLLQTHRYLAMRNVLQRSPSISLKMSRSSGQFVEGSLHTKSEASLDGDIHELMDRNEVGLSVEHKFEDTHVHHDDDSIAQDLYQRVRVLCWIMTSPNNLKKKAIHVKLTWAKRCNVQLFMSSIKNDTFPAVGLNVSEGREHLTAKTMQAFQYIYKYHFNDADWFMKADDDTYVIVENLRYFLSSEDPQEPVFFGLHFKTLVKQGYPSGGGGYVLSKEALRRYAERGAKDPRLCAQDKGSEDVQMGRCLEKLDVKLKSSLDALGRSRFHCFSPETVINGRFPEWFKKYTGDETDKGMENISDYAISFHYVSPEKMYFMEFYTYHLHPYGIFHKPQKLNVH